MTLGWGWRPKFGRDAVAEHAGSGCILDRITEQM